MIGRLANWRAVIRRVRAAYVRGHGHDLRLLRPRRYTEKMQWRKLFDLDPRFGILSDKLAARDFIADRIGPGNLVPLLWQGDDPDQIPFDDLTPPYVMKSTHGCGHTVMVREGSAVDRDHIRALARNWLGHCYGTMMDEPGYINVPRRLVVERLLLAADGTPPAERKMFVFDGSVVLVRNVTIENDSPTNGVFCTPDWQPLAWTVGWASLAELARPPPPLLDEMMQAATVLATGFDHLRVDLYDGGDRFWVGEITLYPWSGLQTFFPDEADFRLGAFWKLRHPMLRAFATMATRPWAIRAPGLHSPAAKTASDQDRKAPGDLAAG